MASTSTAILPIAISWQSCVLTLVVAAAILDIIVYRALKRKLPGALWPLPFVGGVIEMIVVPVTFWQRQIDYCRNGISVNSLAGKFMVFITNSKTCYKVYTNTEDFVLFAHPNAKYLFGEENLIYMDADAHKKMRMLLIPGIYTKEALATYLSLQERVMRKHMDAIAAAGNEVEARMIFRLMNADASQEAFVGPYLNAEEKSWLADEILSFTMGFLSVPIPFPRGGLWRAIRARNGIRKLLTAKMALAEQYIREGHQPRCVVDFWLRELITKNSAPAATHEDLATTILDFMFASQDATTSAVAWALDLLTRRPDVTQRLRDEVAAAAAAMAVPVTGAETEQLLQSNGVGTVVVAGSKNKGASGSSLNGSSSVYSSSTDASSGANGGSRSWSSSSRANGSSSGANNSIGVNGSSSANGGSSNGVASNKDSNGAYSNGKDAGRNELGRNGISGGGGAYAKGQVNGHSTAPRRPLQEYFKDLKYTQNCALELLRYRPPVPMVPHLAKRRVELAPGVVVPKGAMVVPSVVGAAQNEEGANVFDADNLLDPNFNKVFVFGAGQHKCPGRLYASQLLAVFLAVLVEGYSWERRLTEKSANVIYAPTLYQEDNLYTFRKL